MANSQLLYQSYKIICDTTSKVAVKRTTIYLVVNTASKRMLGFMGWTPLESVGEKCATHNLTWRKLVYVIAKIMPIYALLLPLSLQPLNISSDMNLRIT